MATNKSKKDIDLDNNDLLNGKTINGVDGDFSGDLDVTGDVTTGPQLTVNGGTGPANIHIVSDSDNSNENDTATLTLAQDGNLITGGLGFASDNYLNLDHTGPATGAWGVGFALAGVRKLYVDGSGDTYVTGDLDVDGSIKFNGGSLSGGTLNSVIISEDAGNAIFRGLNYDSYWADNPVNSTAFQVGVSGGNTVFTGFQSAVPSRTLMNSLSFQVAPTRENYSTGWPAPLGVFEVLDLTNTALFRITESTGLVNVYNDLDVGGETLFSDKIKFTQTDGNEYIDSLADGYMDYGATTGHRFNAPIKATGYNSSDGTAGITQSETGVTDFDIVIKDGLITSFTKN